MNIQPRPTRRTRAKHGGVKPTVEEKLLAATERLLAKGGNFATLSVEQLAAEAGMSRGTFYLHFRDKGELVARLMDQLTFEMIQSFGIWIENAGIATRKDVQTAVTGMVRTFKKHEVILAAVRDTMVSDENVTVLFTNMVNKIGDMAQRSITTVKQRGLGRTGDRDGIGSLLAWSIALYCMQHIDEHDSESVKKTIKGFGIICNNVIFADDAKA